MSENCLVFESIFGAFWTPKMDEKSMKNRSSGSSWAKMAPRRCHLEPTWLQEPIFIDFESMFTWFWHGFFRYILIDIETSLRANLDSLSREDVKTRSCGVAKAWRRKAVLKMAFVVTFEEAVQRVYALWHFTLLHIALLCLAPCMDMHGFTLVYIYIYLYIRCLLMEGYLVDWEQFWWYVNGTLMVRSWYVNCT